MSEDAQVIESEDAELTQEEKQERLIQSLRPSSWITHHITTPRNVWAKVAKKGGTSKTSSTAIEADAFARLGLNVLVVDFDPQGNISLALDNEVQMVEAGTTKLGGKPLLEPDRNTIVEVVEADADGVVDDGFALVDWSYNPQELFTRGGPLVPGQVGNIGIIPGYKALESFSEQWTLGDLNRFARALLKPSPERSIAPRVRWDVVLLDLPPGGGKIGRQALKAADWGLVVTTAETFGIKAIADTVIFMNDVRDNWDHPSLKTAGFLFTTYSPRKVEARSQIEDLKAARAAGVEGYDIDRWPQSIPAREAIPNSQSYRLPVSRLLTERKSRPGAELVCQVAESVALNMLDYMEHPRAAELRALWQAAWPADQLSPYVTGEWE